MNTIVVNTLNGAVSEYEGFAFQSLTPTYAGDAAGLYELVGDTDNGSLILARVQTGKPSWGEAKKKMLHKIFLGLKGEGAFTVHVDGENDSYEYSTETTGKGEARAQPGRGISETYLSFGFSNPDGQTFELDNIEPITATSTTRRV